MAKVQDRQHDPPDIVPLARWLLTWVTGEGEIHGYQSQRLRQPLVHRADDWCGHTTFASPLIPALAEAMIVDAIYRSCHDTVEVSAG